MLRGAEQDGRRPLLKCAEISPVVHGSKLRAHGSFGERMGRAQGSFICLSNVKDKTCQFSLLTRAVIFCLTGPVRPFTVYARIL